MELREDFQQLTYWPLTMLQDKEEVDLENKQSEATKKNKDQKNTSTRLAKHEGGVVSTAQNEVTEVEMTKEDSVTENKLSKLKLSICVTMFNEPFSQLLESIAGIYRTYYELVDICENFRDNVNVVIVCDGIEHLDSNFKKKAKDAGIFNVEMLQGYFEFDDEKDIQKVKEKKFEEYKSKIKRESEENKNDNKIKENRKEKENMIEIEQIDCKIEDCKLKALDLQFMNNKNQESNFEYATDNLLHCFAAKVTFSKLLEALDPHEQDNFTVNEISIFDFLFGNDEQGRIKEHKFDDLPMKVFLCVKHKNKGKIDSHKWFFKGFCEMTDPEFVQIIDCGSIPMFNSISKIIMHMITFDNVGGTCGEIEVIIPEKNEKGDSLSFFESIVALAQYVEYKISHYLDKATESLFGFVSVLPGAFSTFRWKCIQGDPLNAFLKGAKGSKYELTFNCFQSNMYLAEDRIMCQEIICKPGEKWILNYVPGAICLTDPPLTLTALIKQRRRWFNGSFFATLHVILSMCSVWKREKGFFELFRIMFLLIYFLYMVINMLLSFVLVGSLYASFSIFVRAALPNSDCFNVTKSANILENFYLMCLFFTIMLSTTVNIVWAESFFRTTSVVMGVLTLCIVCFTIYYCLSGKVKLESMIFLGVILLSYLIPLITNFNRIKLGSFLKGVVYVIYMTPTYINIITIYSFSNISDISWGSRPAGANSADVSKNEKEKQIDFKDIRAWFLVFWMIVNFLVGYSLTITNREVTIPYFILGIAYFLLAVISFKLICSLIFYVTSLLWDSWQVNSTIKHYRDLNPKKIEKTEKLEPVKTYTATPRPAERSDRSDRSDKEENKKKEESQQSSNNISTLEHIVLVEKNTNEQQRLRQVQESEEEGKYRQSSYSDEQQRNGSYRNQNMSSVSARYKKSIGEFRREQVYKAKNLNYSDTQFDSSISFINKNSFKIQEKRNNYYEDGDEEDISDST